MTMMKLIEHGTHGCLPFDSQKIAAKIVNILLGDQPLAEAQISEASVHLPRRGSIWIASFTGAAGGQVWRSTGLTDRGQALLVARRWEAEARAERERLKPSMNKSPLRARRSGAGLGSGLLTQREVAALLHMSERGVREVEKRAIRKLRDHLQRVWQQFLHGQLDERQLVLTSEEINALFTVARTPEELLVIQKLLRLVQR